MATQHLDREKWTSFFDRASKEIGVQHPTDVYALETGVGLESIEVIDAEGAKHIVTLKEPLLLAS